MIFGVVFRGETAQFQIEFRELEPGPILEDESFELEAFPVNHRGGHCFGFGFKDPARRPFLNEKASELGVPHGPERRELVKGCSIQLSDGQTIDPDDVLGPTIPGTKLVHVGDVGTTDDLLEYCNKADALVIEATYLDSDKLLAERFGHLTARQAAELAREANVSSLYLTHISRRYRTRDVLAEAAEVFPTVVVARDLDRFQVKRIS